MVMETNAFLPTIFVEGAHTSTISVIHSFITQWYSKEKHVCLILKQFFDNSLSIFSFRLRGHESTTVTVSADSMHFCGFPDVYKTKQCPHFNALQRLCALV